MTPYHEQETNTTTHAKRIMWTCRRTAFAFIRLCGVCLVNRRMLSVCSWYFKEKYIRNHTDVVIHSFGQPTKDQRNTCSFAYAANAEQATFWHSFTFASVSHALFAFVYRCKHTFRQPSENFWFWHAPLRGQS